MKLILLTLTLAACGPTAEQLRARELCYTRAETEAQKRVDIECEGAAFAECQAARDILDDLRVAQEACP
jgi:hypothetical protein